MVAAYGPSLAGLILTAIEEGLDGLKAMARRLFPGSGLTLAIAVLALPAIALSLSLAMPRASQGNLGRFARFARRHARRAAMTDFDTFLEIRRQAAQAYVNGLAGPLDQLAATACPASFFPPRGGREEGAEWVANVYARDAGSFSEGGETTLEILHSDSAGDLGYWTGLQHATVRLTGHDGSRCTCGSPNSSGTRTARGG
jgi:hypothetical protein